MNDNLNIARFNQLLTVSNPTTVKKNLKKYIPKDTPELFISNRKNKKYMILNPDTNKFVHFGSLIYEDLTKHQNKERQKTTLSGPLILKAIGVLTSFHQITYPYICCGITIQTLTIN